jgi:hypothetical protein
LYVVELPQQRTDFGWQILWYLKLVSKSFADFQSRGSPHLYEERSFPRLRSVTPCWHVDNLMHDLKTERFFKPEMVNR